MIGLMHWLFWQEMSNIYFPFGWFFIQIFLQFCLWCLWENFKSKHALHVHKRSVHNRKSLCSNKYFLGFKINSLLLRHDKLIHGIEMKKYNYYGDCTQSHYFCHKCDFKTVHKQNLVKHLDLMHSIPKLIFECENCNYKKSFTRHTENVHLQKDKDPILWFLIGVKYSPNKT